MKIGANNLRLFESGVTSSLRLLQNWKKNNAINNVVVACFRVVRQTP